MKIEQLRSEFNIIFVDENYLNSAEIYQTIADVGYQIQFYPTFDSAMVAIRSSAPHILAMMYSQNELASDRFLNQVRKFSPETQVILMVNETHVMNSIMKTAVGEVFDYVTLPMTSSVELLVRIDRAAHHLYLKFENEQLRKRRSQSLITDPSLGDLSFEEGDPQTSPPHEIFEKIKDQLGQMSAIKDHEELIKKYIFLMASSCGSMPVLYLKYLPMQSSFVHSQSIWTPLADVKNIGFKIGSVDQINDALQEFMEQVFQIDKFGTFRHFQDSQLKGLCIVFNKENPAQSYAGAPILHEFFEAIYARNALIKDFHTQQTIDGLTGLFNKKAFEDQLSNEVSRARRIHSPLSIMKLRVDNFDLLQQKYGDENILNVVKAFARSMKKNFRTIDVLGRVSKSEFCFLLPHTDIRNTLIKAEKIRRAFNQSQFPFLRIEDRSKLTLSIGVSEYPSTSSDADTLMRSCDDALHRVVRNNGNRVAAWQAEIGFRPDFQVSPNRNLE